MRATRTAFAAKRHGNHIPARALPPVEKGISFMSLLKWALIFFVISVVAAIFGFTGISAASAEIARVLFFIFVVIFLVLLVIGLLALGR
jgi:uncharacterized membrane protein YtjA (UPF0391 family)